MGRVVVENRLVRENERNIFEPAFKILLECPVQNVVLFKTLPLKLQSIQKTKQKKSAENK